VFLAAAANSANAAPALISIDGLRPNYVLKADEIGLKIPTLEQIGELIEDLMHVVPADKVIAVVSDHGFLPVSATVLGIRLEQVEGASLQPGLQ
jgi:hypothetical protein